MDGFLITCPRCEREYPGKEGSFVKDRSTKDGFAYVCKCCKREAWKKHYTNAPKRDRKEQLKAWRLANPAKVSAANKRRSSPAVKERERKGRADWRNENREHMRTYARKRYHTNRDSERARQRDKKYGLSSQEFDNMKSAQAGLCGICYQPEDVKVNGVPRELAIDHCHTSGKVRALLCCSCNFALGLFGEDINRLNSAVAYLVTHSTETVEC